MRYTQDDASVARMHEALETAQDEAAEATLEDIRRALPRITGALAASYALRVDEETEGVRSVSIVSSSPYAHAIERGAWVEGPGPHLQGNHVVERTGPGFVEHMSDRMVGR